MAQSLLLACGLTDKSETPEFVHISEENGMDGSFLISALLGQKLRNQDNGVFFIMAQHNFHHYMMAGQRLGYNLNFFKNLLTMDIMEDIMSRFPLSIDLTNLHHKILKRIKSALAGKKTIYIIFDNLAVLLHLGLDPKDIIKLMFQLKQDNYNIITKLGCVGVHKMFNENLIQISKVLIKIIKFESGNFKEADGRIVTVRRSYKVNYGLVKIVKNILYKVNDRNIKIFSPGEVGVDMKTF